MTSPKLGTLLRLRPLSIDNLPSHPSLAPPAGPSQQNAIVKVGPFIKSALDEATAFIDHTVPSTFHQGNAKASLPSSAKVTLLSRNIKASELPEPLNLGGRGEAWFSRRSKHANIQGHGTANVTEFDVGLRQEHSKHEAEYTPDVFHAHKVIDWGGEITSEGEIVQGGYRDVSMSVYEMCHHIPFPCLNRVFAVLVITAKTSEHDFIVVQIPVNTADFPDANVLYTNGRHRRDGGDAQKRKKIVIGEYVSVERVKLTADEEIVWEMATASDAKGWLPMPLQKLGVPGAVVKDVGLFLDWTAQRRNGNSGGA